MPTPTWSHLKPHLECLNKEALVALLRDLYALNADNKVFLSTRFLAASASPEELAAPYRKIVKQVFNPERGTPSFRLSAARKALNDFRKACADPLQVLDFMLFYVEQGVICTNNYGDIDAPFYNSLQSVYQDAVALARKMADPVVIEQLRPRFIKIVRATAGIGWGFHDGLVMIYEEEYPASA